MSSFRKALKSQQRNHHERSQPGFRKTLGLLEKKKDYKLRADDYHKKQNTLAALRKKALEKNPDEFYFKMINSKLEASLSILIARLDGVHVMKKPKEEVEVTEEQKKVMRTQDIRYVEMKRVAEAKLALPLNLIYFQKIERLKGELHLLDAESKPKNKHTFFVDSKKEVQKFDLASHLDTAPELVDRVYNRPTLKTLETKSIQGAVEPRRIKSLARQRKHQYTILSQRIDREKKMFVISQKIQTRKDLQDKTKKVKVKKETPNAAAIYKFEAKRKR
ncbi:unnamed protein product [Menidia menidia]|uniref:U3 small nucleolar RNA-associated protein 11 n=1 Tax=Menidia menidia TaxID=238744 RepID=A0A8S4BS49_9TELE|nr:unnamed protein product [Menidia menidia]